MIAFSPETLGGEGSHTGQAPLPTLSHLSLSLGLGQFFLLL